METIADRKLSDNFSLYELTATSMAHYQERNRDLADDQISKLTRLAGLAEWVRNFLGVPLIIHSGYRCPDLNTAVGSSANSQHILCEAADFVPHGLEIGNAFRLLWKEVRDGRLKVGQLIFETSQRPYGATSWIHISMGEPYRSAERCNQVLRMQDGQYRLFQETLEANRERVA